MVTTLTREQVLAKIAEIEVAISAAIKSQSYTVDSGQTRQTVTRQTLDDLRNLKADYESDLENIDNPGGGILKLSNLPYR